MREIVIKALELAKAVAKLTETTVDDQIIKAVDAILSNDVVLDVIIDLIERWTSGKQPVACLDSANAGLTPEAVDEIDKAGIDIPTILAIVRLIMEIIDKWRNR